MLVHAPEYPALVDGKFDKAMEFDGSNGVYVPIRFLVGFPPSPQPIYVPISTSLGIPENGYTVPTGALSGYVYTDTGGFNEIVTTEPVVPLGEWIHVAFTRSLATGMHLYVNGVEQTAKAIYGTQNPSGS